MVGLFDILGPVMVGPSSSHTAGACRLGLMARAILGETPDSARISLHGSFAATGEGHGTHRAIVGGLVGITPDDLRLRAAFEETAEAHPNSAVFELECEGARVRVQGASVGGGRIEVTEIDGFSVSLAGDYHTLILLAHDEPGTIATVAGTLARYGLNLARVHVDRTGRHQDALMTLEVDDAVPDDAIAEIRGAPWLKWVRRIFRIS
jgi:L-serine dehydratase